MIFIIKYHEDVVSNDIPGLHEPVKTRIKKAIEHRLKQNPELGKPLRRSLKGYRRLRVGNYRIVYRIDQQTVKVFGIINRKNIYEKLGSRLGAKE